MIWRVGIANDAAAIRQLTCAAYAKWVPLIGREPMPMVADYDAALRVHRFDLLHEGEDLVGLIETVGQDGFLLIENVAVRPDRQGKGHGRVLMARAESVAASQGLSEMRLYTNQKFVANIQLYQKLGYRVLKEVPFKEGFTTHMGKAVPPGTARLLPASGATSQDIA